VQTDQMQVPFRPSDAELAPGLGSQRQSPKLGTCSWNSALARGRGFRAAVQTVAPSQQWSSNHDTEIAAFSRGRPFAWPAFRWRRNGAAGLGGRRQSSAFFAPNLRKPHSVSMVWPR